ncbi:hypothetical protein LINPERHAP2_LOCUS3886, partial [Linum perenne]
MERQCLFTTRRPPEAEVGTCDRPASWIRCRKLGRRDGRRRGELLARGRRETATEIRCVLQMEFLSPFSSPPTYPPPPFSMASVLLRQLLPENPPHKLNLRILHTWKFWRSFKAGPIFCFRLRLFYRFTFLEGWICCHCRDQ